MFFGQSHRWWLSLYSIGFLNCGSWSSSVFFTLFSSGPFQTDNYRWIALNCTGLGFVKMSGGHSGSTFHVVFSGFNMFYRSRLVLLFRF